MLTNSFSKTTLQVVLLLLAPALVRAEVQVTVHDSLQGISPRFIGANEGGGLRLGIHRA